MAVIERLQSTLGTLGLTRWKHVWKGCWSMPSKHEPSYADFLVEALGAEAEARRRRYLKTRLQLAHLP